MVEKISIIQEALDDIEFHDNYEHEGFRFGKSAVEFVGCNKTEILHYGDAFLGFDRLAEKAVYSFTKYLDIMICRDGMSVDDAFDYFDERYRRNATKNDPLFIEDFSEICEFRREICPLGEGCQDVDIEGRINEYRKHSNSS